MSPFEIIIVVILGLGLIGAAAAYFHHTNRNQNNGGNNQNNTNLCSGGSVPVPATITITPDPIQMSMYLSLCNKRRPPLWTLIAIAILTLGLIIALILFPKSDSKTDIKDNSTNTQQVVGSNQPNQIPNAPVPPVVAKFPDDYSKAKDMDTVKTLLRDAKTSFDKHVKAGKNGYTIINKKLDDINAGVKSNGTKLDAIDGQLTALRIDAKNAAADAKKLLESGATAEELNKAKSKIDSIYDQIEKLQIQKNTAKKDSD